MNRRKQTQQRVKAHAFLCMSLGLLLSMFMPNAAKAKGVEVSHIFSMITADMDTHRRLQFCGFVAREAANQASEAPDIALRSTRFNAAQNLQSRLASNLAKANVGLTREQSEDIERENGEALGLLSYDPSPQLVAQIQNGGENDIAGLLLSDAVAQCDTLLDTMGVATALPTPANLASVPRSFMWRGKTAQVAFEGTGLARYALQICVGAKSKVADFAGARFAERGKDGVSLLDWAYECRDRSAFKVLLDAGFDGSEPGQFNDPPLVTAAEGDDSWYVAELLAHHVSPDSMGHWRTALAAAYDPLEKGGGKSFVMLRASGGSLDFPNPDKSMWSTWAVFADWEVILANWNEFKSDPIALGSMVSRELNKPAARGNKHALEELKSRLIVDFGVCFPVGSLAKLTQDQRGYYVQPGCSKHAH